MIPDLESWLLKNYGQEVMSPDPGLERIRLTLGDLVEKINKKKIITIAGTNGKGETTLRLSGLLKNKTHVVWTSPHVESVTERFRNENGTISYEALAVLIENCHQDLQSQTLKLSYYEFLFFVFCTWAQSQDSEYFLFEVGLGGRLDAVNVFNADLLLLPSIARDHQEFLGPRYDGILREKLALLRSGSTLISFLGLRYLQERAKTYSHTVGAEHRELDESYPHNNFNFSQRNHLLAHAAYSFLTGDMTPNGLEDLSPLPNRGEVINSGGRIVLFGSHNVDGMRKLIQLLHSDNYTFPKAPFSSVYVAFSKRDEQDLRVLLRMLKRAGIGEIRVTTFPHPKAMSAKAMESLCIQEGLNFVRHIEEELKQIPLGETSLVTGSYYFLGHVKSFLRGR